MQKVFIKEACVSFSSQSNYINNKKKLPGTISVLHCSVEPEVQKRIILSNTFVILFLDIIGVVNLAAKSIKSCLEKLQLRVAVSNVAH